MIVDLGTGDHDSSEVVVPETPEPSTRKPQAIPSNTGHITRRGPITSTQKSPAPNRSGMVRPSPTRQRSEAEAEVSTVNESDEAAVVKFADREKALVSFVELVRIFSKYDSGIRTAACLSFRLTCSCGLCFGLISATSNYTIIQNFEWADTCRKCSGNWMLITD